VSSDNAYYRISQTEYLRRIEGYNAVRAERDALARTLTTLTAAGIVVGEDGAVRWHGLTGAEIEGMKVEISTLIGHLASVLNSVGSGGMIGQMVPGIRAAHDYLAAAAGRGADGEATDGQS
jgi:hypothetical protein